MSAHSRRLGWIEWERGWQRENLASVRRHPTTRARPLTDRVLGSLSRAWYDAPNRRIYLAVRYPGQEAHLAAIDLATQTGVTLLGFARADRHVVYAHPHRLQD